MALQKQKHHRSQHLSVMVEQVLSYLDPKPGESYLDLTAGYGGHAQAVLAYSCMPEGTVLVDRDENAIKALGSLVKEGATTMHMDYLEAARILIADHRTFDMILFDLGVSSPQLDQSERGFSFNKAAPLDMRMDQRQSLTADDIVNEWPEAELAQIIRDYGEEPRAKTIARAIVESRPFNTTTELAAVVKKATPPSKGVHPATRTFQSIRIAVNRELELLEETLNLIPELLSSKGRVVVISFHSLEDRLVKHALKEFSAGVYDAELKLLTKQPITGEKDAVINPRARSAKLRAAVKIKK